MTNEDKFRQASDFRRKEEEFAKERYEDASQQRLADSIRKHMTTIMIGALSAYEDEFGWMWGKGIPFGDLYPEERNAKRAWAETRKRILDNGNKEIGAALQEIQQYKTSWNRFYTELECNPEVYLPAKSQEEADRINKLMGK